MRKTLSPLIYPGGKYWMFPLIADWLDYYSGDENKLFFEPFFGGGNVSLHLLHENKINVAWVTDVNPHAAAFWSTALGKQNKLLAKKALNFDLTRKNVDHQLRKNKTNFDKAFNFLLRSRITYGG